MKRETASSATGPSADRVPTPDLVEQRRMGRTTIAYKFLEEILSGRWHSIATNAPADMRILSIDSDHAQQLRGHAEVIFASELLDPVPEHRDLPDLVYSYQRGSA